MNIKDVTSQFQEVVDSKQKIENSFKMLEDIIAGMPGHVYWTDKNGVYLGCNDLQAKAAGFNFTFIIYDYLFKIWNII